MTVSEAAKRIGISASKLYQLVSARHIAHYRVGGKIIFSESDVDAYLATCRVGAAATAGRANITSASRPRLKHLKLD